MVRIKGKDYEDNVKANLRKGDIYEEIDEDPSKETEETVRKFVDKLKGA